MSIKNNQKTMKNKTEKRTISQYIHGKIIDKKDGWVIVNIYGEPYKRGFAHGFLLYKELKQVLQVLPFIVKEQLEISMEEYMKKSNQLIKPIMKKEFREFYRELEGISDGAKSKKVNISTDFLIAWNAFLTLYSYYKDGSTERCSAFIACGNATEKGDIVMGHNTHSDFATGQILNIVLYVSPTDGYPFVMQTSAGFIASSSDWFLSSSGIIGCETTIANINYKPVFGTPYFCRIRKAMQYGKTMDDYTQILLEKNAGDYACSWLFGDIKKNEIMLFEIGLKIHSIQRTMNGVYYGMNSAIDDELRTKETKDTDFANIQSSSGSRNYRLNYLLKETYYRDINVQIGKKILADHYDVYLSKYILNSRGICKHCEEDADYKDPYYPYGCTDSKIVNSLMASKLSFMGRMGCACGNSFKVKDFIEKHPKYKKWEQVLHDMPKEKWSMIVFDKREK